MTKYLITGSRGLFGREFMRQLGAEAVEFSGDVSNYHDVERNILDHRPDFIINCAGVSESVCKDWRVFESNVLGVKNILDCIARFTRETRLLNFGSCLEFAPYLYSPQDENHPIRGYSFYASSKIASRAIINATRQSGVFAIQPWIYNTTGPKQSEKFIIPCIAAGFLRFLETQQSFFLKSINSTLSIQHVSDVCRACLMMLHRESPVDYVIGGENNISVKEIVDRFIKIHNMDGVWSEDNRRFTCLSGDFPVKVLQSQNTLPVKYSSKANIQKLKNEIGFSHKYSLDQIIQEHAN